MKHVGIDARCHAVQTESFLYLHPCSPLLANQEMSASAWCIHVAEAMISL